MSRPALRPEDLEKRVKAGVLACPTLNRHLGKQILRFAQKPQSSLENRLIRGLYTYANHELNVAFRTEQFLDLCRQADVDYSVPLGAFGGDLDWGLQSLLSELRAGLNAKQEFSEARIVYIPPGKKPTPDFKIDFGVHSQFAEVKSVEVASIFDILLDKIEARALVDSRFSGEYVLSERFYFPKPQETPRDLAVRIGGECDRVLDVLDPQAGSLTVSILGESLSLECVEKLTMKPGPSVTLVGWPGTPLEMMECNAMCCERLSRGILARLVNQVTQAYWKLRDFRGATPATDHIYLDVDFGCVPFDAEIKEKVRAILEMWGISSKVRIHLL